MLSYALLSICIPLLCSLLWKRVQSPAPAAASVAVGEQA